VVQFQVHIQIHTQTVNTDMDKHTCNNAMKTVALANVTALCPTTNSSLFMQPLANMYSHVCTQQESGTVMLSRRTNVVCSASYSSFPSQSL